MTTRAEKGYNPSCQTIARQVGLTEHVQLPAPNNSRLTGRQNNAALHLCPSVTTDAVLQSDGLACTHALQSPAHTHTHIQPRCCSIFLRRSAAARTCMGVGGSHVGWQSGSPAPATGRQPVPLQMLALLLVALHSRSALPCPCLPVPGGLFAAGCSHTAGPDSSCRNRPVADNVRASRQCLSTHM